VIVIRGFQMTVEKPKPKQLFQPITTGTNSTMNQSQFLAIICNSLEAREKSHVRGAIGFGFTCHWSKTGASLFSIFRIITFDSHFENCSIPLIYQHQVRGNLFIDKKTNKKILLHCVLPCILVIFNNLTPQSKR